MAARPFPSPERSLSRGGTDARAEVEDAKLGGTRQTSSDAIEGKNERDPPSAAVKPE